MKPRSRPRLNTGYSPGSFLLALCTDSPLAPPRLVEYMPERPRVKSMSDARRAHSPMIIQRQYLRADVITLNVLHSRRVNLYLDCRRNHVVDVDVEPPD